MDIIRQLNPLNPLKRKPIGELFAPRKKRRVHHCEIPHDEFYHIMNYVTFGSAYNLSLTCKRYYNMCRESKDFNAIFCERGGSRINCIQTFGYIRSKFVPPCLSTRQGYVGLRASGFASVQRQKIYDLPLWAATKVFSRDYKAHVCILHKIGASKSFDMDTMDSISFEAKKHGILVNTHIWYDLTLDPVIFEAINIFPRRAIIIGRDGFAQTGVYSDL